MLVLAAGLLLAGLAAPVLAAGAVSVSPKETVMDEESSIRFAYISWLAAKQEAGMDATVSYISEIHGDTTTIALLKDRFHTASVLIPDPGSGGDPDTSLTEFRELTWQFQDETRRQMSANKGKPEALAAAVHDAVENDKKVHAAEDAYWRTRMTAEPASFDRYVLESQATLNILQENGYNIALAQATLDRISAMRGEFVTALGAKNYGAAEVIRERIDSTAADFERIVRNVRAIRFS